MLDEDFASLRIEVAVIREALMNHVESCKRSADMTRRVVMIGFTATLALLGFLAIKALHL